MSVQSQKNLCIQLAGFDLDAPGGAQAKGVVIAPDYVAGMSVGIRMMTEQECLQGFRSKRSAQENAKFFRARPTIEKWANGYTVGRNTIDPMNIGGLMMFHGCTFDRDNSTDELPVYKAEYAENYGNDMNRAVLYGSGRVNVREYNGRTYANLELLHIQDAVEVKSLDDVANFYAERMTGAADHLFQQDVRLESIGALRLIKDGGKVVARPFYVPSEQVEGKDANGNSVKVRVPGDAMNAMDHAFVQGQQAGGFFKVVAAALDPQRIDGLENDEQKRQASAIRRELEAGTTKVEMINGVKIDIIGDTLDLLLTEKTQLNRQMNKAMIRPAAREGEPEPAAVPGFVRMTVAVAVGKSRAVDQAPGVIVSKFANDEFAKPYSLAHIPTAMSKTAYAKEREQKSVQEAEHAASVGGVSQSEPDFSRAAEDDHKKVMAMEDNSPSP